jgi:hypothetical protein
MAQRFFRIKMRPGRALLGATNDGTHAAQAGADDEVVVPEDTAAFLVRNRAAKVIEVVERVEDSPDRE